MTAVAVGLLATVATFGAVSLLLGRSQAAALRRRVDAYVDGLAEAAPAAAAPGRRERLAVDAERRLGAVDAYARLAAAVDRSGLRVRAVELLTATLAAGVLAGLAAAAALGSALAFLLGLVAAVAAAWLVLRTAAARRARAFDDQLPELLNALAASLRAGHSFSHALQTLAADAEEPARRELERAMTEIRLGRDVDEALSAMSRRIGSADLEFVLTAVAIQRQVGGSLAGLLQIVTETVRRRQQFARKLRALTASGRASAVVLVALPFVVGMLLTALNASYMRPLYATGAGQALVAGSLVMMLCGALALRRVVSFRGWL